MFRCGPRSEPIEVGFYLARHFSIVPFINAVDPLRMANKISGQELFLWRLISNDGQPVPAINDMTIVADLSISEAGILPNVICCSGFEPIINVRSNLKNWLRRLDRRGTHLGALGAASVFLAEAGLLDGHRATIHWQYRESFHERFPFVHLTQNLYEICPTRFTCAGGTAAMDMMIHLISLHFGHGLASDVSDQFIVGEVRRAGNEQLHFRRTHLGVSNPKLISVIDAMELHIEEPLPIVELARLAGLSQRQLERLFRDQLQQSPISYYVGARLRHARRLLLQSTLPVIDVGLASGFASAEHFSRSYRMKFGHSPIQERQLARQLQQQFGRTGSHPL